MPKTRLSPIFSSSYPILSIPLFSDSSSSSLRTRLLLLFLVQGQQRDTSNLDDLETDTRQITNSLSLATETSNQNLIVSINIVQATVTRDKSSDFLSILDQLDTNTLTNSRVGLLGFDSTILS